MQPQTCGNTSTARATSEEKLSYILLASGVDSFKSVSYVKMAFTDTAPKEITQKYRLLSKFFSVKFIS